MTGFRFMICICIYVYNICNDIYIYNNICNNIYIYYYIIVPDHVYTKK